MSSQLLAQVFPKVREKVVYSYYFFTESNAFDFMLIFSIIISIF